MMFIVGDRRPDTRLLCLDCATRLKNRKAYYRLMYEVRGEHVCEGCGKYFRVDFKEVS